MPIFASYSKNSQSRSSSNAPIHFLQIKNDLDFLAFRTDVRSWRFFFRRVKPNCPDLPDVGRLRSVLQSVVKQGPSKKGGMGNQEWAVIVNRDGIGCVVVYSGTSRAQEWPGSRVIAASKANTANGLSNDNYVLSTANMRLRNQGKVYTVSQPAGRQMHRRRLAIRFLLAQTMTQWSEKRSEA